MAAPAGFGKTTLICNWIQQLNLPVAWFSISEIDNDPSTFLSYVVAALQTIDSSIGESSLPVLHSSQPDYEGVLSNLIRDIFQDGLELVLVIVFGLFFLFLGLGNDTAWIWAVALIVIGFSIIRSVHQHHKSTLKRYDHDQ